MNRIKMSWIYIISKLNLANFTYKLCFSVRYISEKWYNLFFVPMVAQLRILFKYVHSSSGRFFFLLIYLQKLGKLETFLVWSIFFFFLCSLWSLDSLLLTVFSCNSDSLSEYDWIDWTDEDEAFGTEYRIVFLFFNYIVVTWVFTANFVAIFIVQLWNDR